MRFVALDVETANADISSICQIGIARFEDNRLVGEWCSLIDPEDYFDPTNIYIHRITEMDIEGAPKLNEVAQLIYEYLDGAVAVCHTPFDRAAIGRAFDKYEIRAPEPQWLDTARVARRAWDEVSWRGYGLADVCSLIGYEFEHHNAVEDAKASGRVLIAAMAKTGLSIEDWLKRVKQPIDPSNVSTGGAIRRDGNPEGAMYGENVVFTGALTIRRKDAADLAAELGCNVESGVTKRTTMLVVGDQDVTKLAGKNKSSKHRKAEQLITRGQQIRILRESDFNALVDEARPFA